MSIKETINKSWHILSLFLVLILSGCTEPDIQISPAINTLTDTDFLHNEHDSLIYEQVKHLPNGTELSLGFLVNNEPFFVGLSRINDSLTVLANSESLFEIGSISKIFTSTLLADLVINTDLDLNSAINPYLDFQLADSTEISFKELANHTSGLPRMPSNFFLGSLFNSSNPYKNYDLEKLTDYLSDKFNLNNTIEKTSSYSNLGVALLGFSLSEITGEDYESMLQKHIFEPYSMSSSTTQREKIKPLLVQGLDEEGYPTPNWDLNAFTPAGGILSSITDLSKFASAQFDTTNYVLNLTREVTYSDTTNMEVGLGWHIINTESGDRWHWHNGGTGGYRSSMTLNTKLQNAVIILSNVSARSEKASNIDVLCFALMKSISQI